MTYMGGSTNNPYGYLCSNWNWVNGGKSISITTSGQSSPINVGDTVRVIDDRAGHRFPKGYIFVVTYIEFSSSYSQFLITEQSRVLFSSDLEVIQAKNQKKKEISFNLDKLNSLVIDPEAKKEIVAVLKQYKFRDHLFDKWGLSETIEYGKGMTFLFYGGPGTGKTWAAECIAKVLGMSLMRITGAEIQTSDPGGAERNIKEAFSNSKNENKLLFFDECDSLIYSRNDVGMILGSEINTLLTEIEHYEGIVILATNRVENLDAALERRIALIVEFPEPTFDQRMQIWEKLLPKKLPLHDTVSLSKLAEYKLTGGQIKNVILQAARLALSNEESNVSLDHFVKAIERVNKSKSLLGTKSNFNQGDYHIGHG